MEMVGAVEADPDLEFGHEFQRVTLSTELLKIDR